MQYNTAAKSEKKVREKIRAYLETGEHYQRVAEKPYAGKSIWLFSSSTLLVKIKFTEGEVDP